ncbi:glycoside hydrolase family 3 N-terminal domain-containing protein [Mageeibacillus indolicus]|uniref:glycoside hydrolase family 3 N-terminal domain-containing protein n=1 Tax=Mageeibacillus indolicus TaxID=884684 RepID=UPI0015E093F7|nr:glycoside hydrolase family 3 N-terminal domain-containing protein [Mageeibacillus indolicus]
MNYKKKPKNDREIQQAVQELLAKMTLPEKLGQMTQAVGAEISYIGSTGKGEPVEQRIREGKIGSMILVDEPTALAAKIKHFQKMAVEESRLGIPLLFAQDVIHGFETVFPIPLAWSSSFDLELIQGAAEIAAKEAAACGINYVYSPMVDLVRDPRWGRVAESAGEDPFLGSAIAAALVRGYQGEKIGCTSHSVAACLKHFLGYGAAEAGRDYNTVDFSSTTMFNHYLLPFKAGIDAGAASIMAAFNVVDGVPVTANYKLLTEILRNKLNFTGVVISDYNGVLELIAHGVAVNEKEAAAKALKAGLDIEMTTNFFNRFGEELCCASRAITDNVDRAVTRILTLKYQLGLMDDPFRSLNSPEKIKSTVFCREHLAYSRKLAENSVVLLKNDSILPIKAEQKVALIGPFAESKDLCGCWSFSTRKNETTDLKSGFELLGWKVMTEAGCAVNEKINGGLQRAKLLAEKSDLVILVLGENDVMSGEACSRMSISLPAVQQELAESLAEIGVPLVLCLMNGRPLLLNWYAEHCQAILQCYQLGSQAGLAIAKILIGQVNPSGKLTMSIPYAQGQIPVYYNHLSTGRPLLDETSEEHFLSRYLDGPNHPLYPFGFGLSYTEFRMQEIELDKPTIAVNEEAEVAVTLANIGKYEGSEVVQLYIRDPSASIARPVKELKGFKKISLLPGQKKQVNFKVNREMLSFYDSDGELRCEPGLFILTLATSSDDAHSLNINLEVVADEK